MRHSSSSSKILGYLPRYVIHEPCFRTVSLGVDHTKFAKVNRRTWKRIRLVLQKEEALADISKTVRQIERLASEKISTFLKPSRQNAQIYSRFRKDAIDLHNTLLESFCAQQSCSCSAPHNANLRLQRMSKQKSNIAGPRFSVLLSFDICSDIQSAPLWAWREIEFEPLDNHDGPATAR